MWKPTILNKHLSAELQVKSCVAFLTTTEGLLTAHTVQRILLHVNNSVLLWCVRFIASAQANWTENAQLLHNNHSMGNSMTKTWPCRLPLELFVEQKLEGFAVCLILFFKYWTYKKNRLSLLPIFSSPINWDSITEKGRDPKFTNTWSLRQIFFSLYALRVPAGPQKDLGSTDFCASSDGPDTNILLRCSIPLI